MEVFDIDKLYLTVFGTIAAPFPAVRRKAKGYDEAEEFDEDDVKITPQIIEEEAEESFNYTSALGTRYKLPVKMGNSAKIDEQEQLPNEPVMSIRGMKQMKLSPVNRPGNRGTIKEERTLNDYEIKIIGFCINSEKAFPTAQVELLKGFYEKPGVVYISSLFTRVMGITKISIKNIELPRFPELPVNVQPYTITALSDFDFEDYREMLNAG